MFEMKSPPGVETPLAGTLIQRQRPFIRITHESVVNPGVLRWEGGGHEWTALVHGAVDLQSVVAVWGARIVKERGASLDEIFVGHAGSAAAPVVDDSVATAVDANA